MTKHNTSRSSSTNKTTSRHTRAKYRIGTSVYYKPLKSNFYVRESVYNETDKIYEYYLSLKKSGTPVINCTGETHLEPARNTADAPVGYCNPPKEYQFKPGSSGNPKGRPLTSPSTTEPKIETSKFGLGETVHVDDDCSLRMRVIEISWQGREPRYRLSWFVNGTGHSEYFDQWRITRTDPNDNSDCPRYSWPRIS